MKPKVAIFPITTSSTGGQNAKKRLLAAFRASGVAALLSAIGKVFPEAFIRRSKPATWLATVAMAAPASPNRAPTTSNRSPKQFKTAAKPRAMSGVIESLEPNNAA